MNPEASLAEDLKRQITLCQEILSIVEQENQTLTDPDASVGFSFCQARKQLLPRLNESLERIRRHRLDREARRTGDAKVDPEISRLLRQSQDLVMKIIVLDRDNEQGLLRRGLVPARHLPAANRQRPHFVAELYRRGGGC